MTQADLIVESLRVSKIYQNRQINVKPNAIVVITVYKYTILTLATSPLYIKLLYFYSFHPSKK